FVHEATLEAHQPRVREIERNRDARHGWIVSCCPVEIAKDYAGSSTAPHMENRDLGPYLTYFHC
ncbi:MAG: hypothetical protein MUF01_17325, partial [Bryobacterales bacterium]|nr:hypothetical protein [Bryobacterales bacterium]